jgi:hypothetical protein
MLVGAIWRSFTASELEPANMRTEIRLAWQQFHGST